MKRRPMENIEYISNHLTYVQHACHRPAYPSTNISYKKTEETDEC